MDKRLWKRTYKDIPRFPCPRCGEGRLVQKKGYEIKQYEPNWVTSELDDAGLRGEMSSGRFAGLLRCDVSSYDETVAVCGDYTSKSEAYFHQMSGEWDAETETEYTITRLTPMPQMITIPEKLSGECRDQIDGACELYFVNSGACANKLRVAVERLLDHLSVPTKGPGNKGQIVEWKLFHRIDELDKIKPGHKDTLDALRHVGNVGSHEGDADFDTVTKCFELLELALEDLIEGKRAELIATAKGIVARKGKPVP